MIYHASANVACLGKVVSVFNKQQVIRIIMKQKILEGKTQESKSRKVEGKNIHYFNKLQLNVEGKNTHYFNKFQVNVEGKNTHYFNKFQLNVEGKNTHYFNKFQLNVEGRITYYFNKFQLNVANWSSGFIAQTMKFFIKDSQNSCRPGHIY